MLQTIVYIFFQNVGVFKFKLKKKNTYTNANGVVNYINENCLLVFL